MSRPNQSNNEGPWGNLRVFHRGLGSIIGPPDEEITEDDTYAGNNLVEVMVEELVARRREAQELHVLLQ